MDGWHFSRWTSTTTTTPCANWCANAAGGCRSASTATGRSSALYHVGGCPTFAYVFPGGTLQSASVGDLTAGQLSARLDDLLRATRAVEGGGEG